MFTERFDRIRKESLKLAFEKQTLIGNWKNIVKDQLRRLDIKDLYDYYDLFYNIKDRAADLRTDILNGNYKPAQPLIYRLEKKLGICRHIIAPQPIDALVLQTITEVLSKEIINQQPSKNAFYSQDKHNIHRPHEVGDDYSLNWKELWKKLQKQIYQFTEEKELLVVTDLSNYYDSIDIVHLKKTISHYINGKDVYIDLLFKIIEDISWTPDYLPYSGRGLPTSNLEGIRLLAHLFLFELDSILKQKTNDCFTRWMDDIVIGVNTRSEAIETISSASDILKSRGLALNIAKTHVYDAPEAKYHFQIEENLYLDDLNFRIFFQDREQIAEEAFQAFKLHFEDQKARSWEKITKRYLTFFAKLRYLPLLADISKLYVEHPGIRPNILYYLYELGFNEATSTTVLEIIKELTVYDDISLFQVCELVTKWKVTKTPSADIFLNSFEEEVFSVSKRRKLPFDFYCILWFKAKYRSSQDISTFIFTFENIWKTHPFLRRQVVSLMSRLFAQQRDKTESFLGAQVLSGNYQTVGLATQILEFSRLNQMQSNLSWYLFPPKAKKVIYPLSKFLVLSNVLASQKIRSWNALQGKIKEYISDPYYLHWLKEDYGIVLE